MDVEVTLRQNADVGRAELIERIVSVIAEEEPEKVKQKHGKLRKVSEVNSTQTKLHQYMDQPIPDHLKDLYEKSVDGKSQEQQRTVAALLCKFGEAFSKNEWDVGLTNAAEHSIDTGDAKPIKQRPRRVPLAFAEEEKSAIDDLLKKGVIQKSTSPWASPIVFVRKKSGAVRPCVDYRKLNAVVKPDGFPLPRTQDCLDAIAGSAYFSSFDLTTGYFQIPVKSQDIPKTAFTCKYGL